MANAQHCLAMAEEAERLASIVSYGRDKVRLKEQAKSWREQAESLDSGTPHKLADREDRHVGVMVWLRRRWA